VTTSSSKSGLEKALGIVTEVEPGEGPTAVVMTLNVFLLLAAYYFIKPVREALILTMPNGAEYKSYMSAAIAVLLLVAVPLYAAATNRLSRSRLVLGVTLFFASHLVLFYFASLQEGFRQYIGLVFFAWVGIFNMMVVAQFWAFAADLYTEAQGKRLFALLGLGASLGAAIGSKVSTLLVEPLGVYQMLLVAAGLLVACAFLGQWADARESGRAEKKKDEKKDKPPEPSKDGAFKLVLTNPYLRAIAFFSLIFTCVNTNGEYMLGSLASEAAEAAGGDKKEYLSKFYGDFFFYVNTLGVLLQTFVVSRVVKKFGLPAMFMVFPLLAFADATLIAIMPVLMVVRIGKVIENATDYSLNNTLRNMLWLPTTRDQKYKAKQATDTFFVRMGDVASAGVVFLATSMAWGVRGVAIVSAVMAVIWFILARVIGKDFAKLESDKPKNEVKVTG